MGAGGTSSAHLPDLHHKGRSSVSDRVAPIRDEKIVYIISFYDNFLEYFLCKNN